MCHANSSKLEIIAHANFCYKYTIILNFWTFLFDHVQGCFTQLISVTTNMSMLNHTWIPLSESHQKSHQFLILVIAIHDLHEQCHHEKNRMLSIGRQFESQKITEFCGNDIQLNVIVVDVRRDSHKKLCCDYCKYEERIVE